MNRIRSDLRVFQFLFKMFVEARFLSGRVFFASQKLPVLLPEL